ncbi:hypothetical protein COT95_00510 [Candidatus Falkowbacteria bacterium CG10_big_fil_rev_8_21_14_0_10_37_6]|uniref:DUF4190 domain-containing protein n=1 Tax=Candidatus Falkowbacteria bacterium CG10_big_fil_rev_8_21_14_0_10_37_6 TaxID=1974563 RepID=A0A2H0V7M5_9BACT|nr:MAG: hypothetical protein COT95_00510 [Candidatus Falkowbacteria bacterium CG10_big_fil_rev_8_21_14_0_10_37_6]
MKKLLIFCSVFALVALSGVVIAVDNAVAATAELGESCESDDCAAGLICNSLKICEPPAAESDSDFLWGGYKDDIQNTTGLGAEDPRQIAASVINVILGFLGIIAVVLILAGGFRWMTAQGNDDAIAGAKNLMVAGVVGLVIILAAFGIAKFVIEALVGATT